MASFYTAVIYMAIKINLRMRIIIIWLLKVWATSTDNNFEYVITKYFVKLRWLFNFLHYWLSFLNWIVFEATFRTLHLFTNPYSLQYVLANGSLSF